MHESIGLDTLLQSGFIGIVGLSLLERVVPVIPSYVMLVLLGFTAAQGTGAFAGTVAATVLGSLAGSAVWYFIGHAIGEARVRSMVGRYGRYFFLKMETCDWLVAVYRRNYFLAAMIGQVIPTVRIFTALPAGVLRLPLPSFLLATCLGILAWNLTFVSAGFILQDTGIGPARTALIAIVGLVVFEAAVALCLFFGRKCLAE